MPVEMSKLTEGMVVFMSDGTLRTIRNIVSSNDYIDIRIFLVDWDSDHFRPNLYFHDGHNYPIPTANQPIILSNAADFLEPRFLDIRPKKCKRGGLVPPKPPSESSNEIFWNNVSSTLAMILSLVLILTCAFVSLHAALMEVCVVIVFTMGWCFGDYTQKRAER